jgi:HD-like signal output (HDOD) protein
MTDPYRALVVDDEAALRNLTIRALHREGFSCDSAANGLEAGKLIQSNRYDVVITDLLMPDRNGHALASDLLASEDRPVVVILTGVLEPKLARDLTARGADCIEFKPVNYALFSAKVRGLVSRRRQRDDIGESSGEHGGSCLHEHSPTHADGGEQEGEPPAVSDIEGRLSHLSQILPLSQAAFDVFSMTSGGSYDTPQIAAAIARDASLSVDVLRLANSTYYDPAGRKVVELEDAVFRIGQRRVGELALAMSTLTALRSNMLPWMNGDLAWRRSVAAGVAIDFLLSQRACPGEGEGLFLSATMHPLGRVALGMLYPRQYQWIVNIGREQERPLEEQEQRLFGLAHEHVMASLLEAWNVPEQVYAPLKRSADTYGSLARLEDPLRMKTELVKVAVLIARIAAGEWESWDQIDLPPAPVLTRLAVESFSDIIQNTRADSQEIIRFRPQTLAGNGKADNSGHERQPLCYLSYCSLSSEPFDFLGEIVSSMNIGVKACEPDGLEPNDAVLVNCIGCPPHRLVAHLDPRRKEDALLIVTDSAQAEKYSRFGRVLALPATFGALRAACGKIAKPPERPTPVDVPGRR